MQQSKMQMTITMILSALVSVGKFKTEGAAKTWLMDQLKTYRKELNERVRQITDIPVVDQFKLYYDEVRSRFQATHSHSDLMAFCGNVTGDTLYAQWAKQRQDNIVEEYGKKIIKQLRYEAELSSDDISDSDILNATATMISDRPSGGDIGQLLSLISGMGNGEAPPSIGPAFE